MVLNLKIEDQQAGTLHSSATRALNIAAMCPSLDRAEEVLRAHLSNERLWLIGRGGHHVWVSWHTSLGPVRVAMIEEVQS